MTFGDLDAVDIADYRLRSESEVVGLDFPRSADLKRVFEDAGVVKSVNVDAEDQLKHDVEDGDSIIFLEERSAVINAQCTLFKKDSGEK